MNNTITRTEDTNDIQMLSNFIQAVYDQGCKDTLKGVMLGGTFTVAACIGIDLWNEWRKNKKLQKAMEES